ALPVFIFAFTCQQNIFSICNEVKNSTRGRIDRIIVAAYLIAGLSFCFAAVLGYWTFGNEIPSDVLKGYPETYLVAATRLLYCLLALFSYPLQ
ncbi:avt5, partial [Symbiodinium necroappetens]